ncbi:MAG: hypothetical protein MN733_25780, partial [Nitrososphaera sp.]|nr:hypothetical protein [Nitrososphaera sp.]
EASAHADKVLGSESAASGAAIKSQGCDSFSFFTPSTWKPALQCAFSGALIWGSVIALVIYAAYSSKRA